MRLITRQQRDKTNKFAVVGFVWPHRADVSLKGSRGRLPPFFRVIQSELGWSGLYQMIISVFDAPSCRSQVVWQSMQNRASTF